MSDWELVEEPSSNQSEWETVAAQEQPGFFKSLGEGYLNYLKGAARGTAQGLGDIGASMLNAPISIGESITGRKLRHVPHPALLNENPASLAESVGQNLGQFTAGLDVPGGAGIKTAQLLNKGYKALRGGEELPFIGKLFGGMAGGAAEGALGSEDNRKLGAGIGAVTGGAGIGVSSGANLIRNIKSSNIAKSVESEVNRMGQDFNERFTHMLLGGEDAGANSFLKPEKSAKIPLLKKAGQGKLAYGIEKYNANPTLTNAHKAQSDLNKIVNRYAHSREGSLEADAYDEALRLKNRLLQKISESFEKSGAKDFGTGYQQARVDYAKEAAPYLNSPTVQGYLGKNKYGARTVRPSKFADKLLQEEDFMARAGHKHPGLLQREITKQIIKHPATKIAAFGAAAYLPYEIRKVFETLHKEL